MGRLSLNLGTSTSWSPQGLSKPVMGLLYLYLLKTQSEYVILKAFPQQKCLGERGSVQRVATLPVLLLGTVRQFLTT
jgi:hypothetical protein